MNRRPTGLLALMGCLSACTTGAPAPQPPADPVQAPAGRPQAAAPFVLSFDELWTRTARPRRDHTNARRVPLAALPGSLALEHLSILSSLRDQSRTQHDQVWLLLNGEGDLGLASSGSRLITGTIAFIPADAVHYFTTIPRVESCILTVVGPDLDLGDVVFPQGARAAPAPNGPNALNPPQALPVKPQAGTNNGVVVHWDAERNRLISQLGAAKGTYHHPLYAGRYLVLMDAAVVDHFDFTQPVVDQTLIVIEQGKGAARLILGDQTYAVGPGHSAMIPAGVKARIEGGTIADPVLVVIVQKTDLAAAAAAEAAAAEAARTAQAPAGQQPPGPSHD